MTVFIPPPETLSEAAWDELVIDDRMTYRDICTLARVLPRVSGANLEREILIGNRSKSARLCRDDFQIFVALPKFSHNAISALRVLEILAYGFNDYAAREAVCGRGLFLPTAPRGRPRTGKALSASEKMRRSRIRNAAK